MPIYTCPECNTKLKKAQPVQPGKKLRCPECDAVFAVKGEKKAPPPKPAPTPALADDDDGPAMYGVTKEEVDKEAEKIRQEAFDPLKERFEKSKRGPALQLVVKPSNVLLASGVLTCIMGLAGIFIAVFPLIFKVQEVNNAKPSLYTKVGENKTKYKEVSDEDKVLAYWTMGGCALFFLWGCVVTSGASKLHELEMYWLAMTGSIMGLVGPLIPLGIWLYFLGTAGTGELDMAYGGPAMLCFFSGIGPSLWAISTLRNKKVLAGFAEEPME